MMCSFHATGALGWKLFVLHTNAIKYRWDESNNFQFLFILRNFVAFNSIKNKINFNFSLFCLQKTFFTL